MEVKICYSCKGLGEITKYYGAYYKEIKSVKCNSCNGTGRILTKSYIYNIPFDTNKLIIYEYDSKLFNLIKELETKIIKQ